MEWRVMLEVEGIEEKCGKYDTLEHAEWIAHELFREYLCEHNALNVRAWVIEEN